HAGGGPLPLRGRGGSRPHQCGQADRDRDPGLLVFLERRLVRDDPGRPHRPGHPGGHAGQRKGRPGQLDDPGQDGQGHGRRHGPVRGRQAGGRDDGTCGQGQRKEAPAQVLAASDCSRGGQPHPDRPGGDRSDSEGPRPARARARGLGRGDPGADRAHAPHRGRGAGDEALSRDTSGLRKERFQTDAEIPIQEVYRPDDVAALDYRRDLADPGKFPFTRGVQRTMYRGRLWTMRQYAGFGTARASNARYKYLLAHGQTGLSVAFDLPTQMGRDSDHALARGEVGRTGVAISSLEDMRVLLDGIPLGEVSTSMTINATAATLLCLYIAVADEQGVPREKLGGTVQNDILKEYIARGTYIYPPRPSLRIITDLFGFCQREVPRWNVISVSGYHIREAGSDAVQEVAFTLADGIAYVQAAVEAGLAVDAFAPRLAFFFNGHNNFLEEVAKYRAARRLWARIMRERFSAHDPRSGALRFHTQPAGSTLTAQQPLNNVVRTTVQALAAVLGGTQSLHTNAYDEALALPTAESARLALR